MNFRRAALTAGNTIFGLVKDFVSHPISCVLLVVILGMLLTSSKTYKSVKEKRAVKRHG